MRAIFAVAAIAAALTLAGCGKHDSSNSSTGSGSSDNSSAGTGASGGSSGGSTVTSVTGGTNHMTITGSNGEKVEIGTGASAKLPDYIPMYPGGTVTSSFTGSGKDGGGGVVVFHAKGADPAAVVAFYKDKAKAAGMADKVSMDMGGTLTYVASNEDTDAGKVKGGKKTLSVSATKKDDGADVQLTWGTN
jgi:hypothetical protein